MIIIVLHKCVNFKICIEKILRPKYFNFKICIEFLKMIINYYHIENFVITGLNIFFLQQIYKC